MAASRRQSGAGSSKVSDSFMSLILISFLKFHFSQDIDEVTAEHNDSTKHYKQIQGFLIEQPPHT
jgi:hypothetical protein